MDFHSLLPDLQPWVKSLAAAWPGSFIKANAWIFPVIESIHLLGLATLGGCVLLPNLRLMGVGLTGQSAATIERNVRPWLLCAILVLVVTGLLMGTVLAQKLYSRPAFFIKMIGLAAALMLSLGVTGSVARHAGAVTLPAKVLAGIALALWLFAVTLFATTPGPAPGAFNLVFAGWLIAMGFGSRMTRLVLGAITAAGVAIFGTVTSIIYDPIDNYEIVMDIDRWTLRFAGLLVTGFVLWEFAGPRAGTPITPRLARLIGLITILCWVTVAASGRWIGLGGSGR